jgi:hypothetical protein
VNTFLFFRVYAKGNSGTPGYYTPGGQSAKNGTREEGIRKGQTDASQ